MKASQESEVVIPLEVAVARVNRKFAEAGIDIEVCFYETRADKEEFGYCFLAGTINNSVLANDLDIEALVVSAGVLQDNEYLPDLAFLED